MFLHFVVAESQDTNATRFEKLCARSIIFGLCWTSVNASIHFDFELMFDAEGIENEAAVRMLPPKLQPCKAAGSQRLPQLLFSGRRRAALLAGSVNDLGGGLAACFSGHRLCLTPRPPLPKRKGCFGRGGETVAS